MLRWISHLRSRQMAVLLLAALLGPCSSVEFIPIQVLEAERILPGGESRPADIPGESLGQAYLARRIKKGDIRREKYMGASAPAIVRGVKAKMHNNTMLTPAQEEVEAGEAVENERWSVHVRAMCTASFASGLTVGVVITLLLLSIGSDRWKQPAKDRHVSNPEVPEASASSDLSARQTSPRCTDSVESIHRFSPRCGFLIGMLLVQSLSSLMLAGFQDMIRDHPSIVFFLTMVVGTGGNVGGQSVVLAVRRLAYGEEVSLREQVAVGIQLSAVLAPLALLRAYVQGTKLAVCLVIGVATMLIVVTAAALGTALPKLLNRVRVDPAHATPVIQVLMDMVGVLVTCVIGYAVLDIWLKRHEK